MRGRADHISTVFTQRRSRDGLGHAPSVGEVRPCRRSSAGKRVNKSFCLDRLEIVEADVMSCDGDKS
jgi:hypothetical protein